MGVMIKVMLGQSLNLVSGIFKSVFFNKYSSALSQKIWVRYVDIFIHSTHFGDGLRSSRDATAFKLFFRVHSWSRSGLTVSFFKGATNVR